MERTFRLFVAEEDGEPVVYTEEMLEGMDEPALVAAFGPAARWHTITLRPPVFSLQEEAKRRSLIADKDRGFVVDPCALPIERARAMVQAWTFDAPPGELDAIPLEAANLIDNRIQQAMYPTAFRNQGFTKALQHRAAPSATPD